MEWSPYGVNVCVFKLQPSLACCTEQCFAAVLQY